MDNEASMIYKYTFISKVNSKFFHQKFTLTWDADADANPYSTLFEAYHCLFMRSSKKAFLKVLSYDFQVCVSNMATLFNRRDLWCALHRWSCELTAKKAETIWTFLEYIVVKSFDNYTFLERTLNLQC